MIDTTEKLRNNHSLSLSQSIAYYSFYNFSYRVSTYYGSKVRSTLGGEHANHFTTFLDYE
jgi:hypothetical protein